MLSFFRSNKMQAIAVEMDMDYLREASYREFKYLEVFPLFQRKRRQRIRHVLSTYYRHLDVNLDIFDFGHRVGKNVRWKTVVLAQSRKLGLPQFILRPAHVGDRLMEIFSGPDINFELYPRFSRNYTLKGPNEMGIRYLMQDPLLEYFNGRPGWHLEGLDDMFVFYRKRKRFKAKHLPEVHQMALDVCELVLKGGGAGGYI